MNLPDDVADYVTQHPEVAEAMTQRAREIKEHRETVAFLLHAIGLNITEEAIARWPGSLMPLSDEQRAANHRMSEAIKAGRLAKARP